MQQAYYMYIAQQIQFGKKVKALGKGSGIQSNRYKSLAKTYDAAGPSCLLMGTFCVYPVHVYIQTK